MRSPGTPGMRGARQPTSQKKRCGAPGSRDAVRREMRPRSDCSWQGGAPRSGPQPGNQNLEDGERDEVEGGCHGEDEQRVQREVVLDDPREGGPAECACGPADADHGGDCGGWEHVCRRGQEVGAPALVGRGGERDQQRRGPSVMREEDAEMRHEDNRDDQQGAQQHGNLASEVDRVPAVDEEAGEPSPSDGTDARYAIDGGQIPVGVDELEAVVAIEKLGQIEEIEPPDAVGKRLADGEGIEAGAAQQNGVGNGVVAANVVCKVGFKVGLGLGGSCDADGCRGRTARQ